MHSVVTLTEIAFAIEYLFLVLFSDAILILWNSDSARGRILNELEFKRMHPKY